MTILGFGLDVVDVEAFAQQLADPASGFVDGTFTAAEQADAAADPAGGLAVRFAAKEAFVKAWSVARFGRPPAAASVDLREIEVHRDGWGRPALQVRGAVAAAVADMHDAPVVVHVSLSRDGAVAAAAVTLSVGAA